VNKPNKSGPASPAAKGAKTTSPEPRRTFFGQAAAIFVSGLVLITAPIGAGMCILLDPLRRKRAEGKFLPATTLDSVPDDGVPRPFKIIDDRIDKWNRSREPVGVVYLVRKPGEDLPTCLHGTCPHAGCLVGFDPGQNAFKCPCHNSSFTPSGQMIQPSPSPRDMDVLACKLEGDEVLVEYQNFYSGTEAKRAK
jgi:nitrite reductase/ring-hydroxylating ferredoxin subunit